MSSDPGKKGTPPPKTPPPAPPPPRQGAGWQVMSYLIGGMVLYGAIGWLVGRWTHFADAFPIGMLVGLALGLALVIFRFGRPQR